MSSLTWIGVALLLLLSLTGLTLLVPTASTGSSMQGSGSNPVVVIETSMGMITLELFADKSPVTVENFLKYVDKTYYDNLIFHRVIAARDGRPAFMIQGGGFAAGMIEQRGGLLGPIRNESGNGVSNRRGTVAMARTSDPNSAQAQFFINLSDNTFLDGQGGQPGYAVFGQVTEGMDVVDAISKVEVTTKRDQRGTPHDDVPVEPVIIKSIRRKPAEA